MTRFVILSLFGAALFGAVPASPTLAQSPSNADAAYCDKLIDTYNRYIGRSDFGTRKQPGGDDIEGRDAVSKCQTGNTAAGIPVLERKLRANGLTLPSRG